MSSTHIYTLSLHDALPISCFRGRRGWHFPERRSSGRPTSLTASGKRPRDPRQGGSFRFRSAPDRKSTRLNSSHRCISYAVFCLKKKNDYYTYYMLEHSSRV